MLADPDKEGPFEEMTVTLSLAFGFSVMEHLLLDLKAPCIRKYFVFSPVQTSQINYKVLLARDVEGSSLHHGRRIYPTLGTRECDVSRGKKKKNKTKNFADGISSGS